MLIDSGADIHSTNDENGTVLHVAANSSEPGLIPYLLAAGAGCYLNSRLSGTTPYTPLMVACTLGSLAAAQRLLEAGAEVGAKTDHGITALHVASSEGQHNIVELLIAAGADVEAVTDEGRTPLDYAIRNGHKSVAALLQAAAARREGGQPGAEPVR